MKSEFRKLKQIELMQNPKTKIKQLLFLAGTMAFLVFLPFSSNQALAAGTWRYEGVAFYVPRSSSGNRPVYRFYSPLQKAHFFTISKSEKDEIIAKYSDNEWRYEGIAYYVPSSSDGNRPVYRFYSPMHRAHFFTISKGEKDEIIAKYSDNEWRYEGIAYYVPSSSDGNRPVYRFYHTGNNSHFFTISENEKERLLTPLLGPNITVGLWSESRSGLQDNPVRIKANKDYRIRHDDGSTIAVIDKDTITRVTYDGDGKLRVYDSVSDTLSPQEVFFEAADGTNSNMIFDVYRPDSPYDQYRGKIKVRYSDASKNIWVINTLPLEHYVWGDGELAGTGDMDHNRVMVTSFRTYGYWKLLYSTKYATEGFKVDATPGNQLYKGYDYEKEHTRIRQAAEDTQGKIVKYDGDIAITPYSSYTDGRTRSWEERWGSKNYPWCRSVDDPYGKHPSMSTAELEAAGNHMVGLSAHGSLHLAGEHNWSWEKIIHYYFHDVDITKIY